MRRRAVSTRPLWCERRRGRLRCVHPVRLGDGMLQALHRQRRFAQGTLAALPQAASSRGMGSSGFTVPQLASHVAQCGSPHAAPRRWNAASTAPAATLCPRYAGGSSTGCIFALHGLEWLHRAAAGFASRAMWIPACLVAVGYCGLFSNPTGRVMYRSFVCGDPYSVCGRHVHTQYSVRAVSCKLLR